jgi:hypothetical protein
MARFPSTLADKADAISHERLGRLSEGVRQRNVIPYVGAGMSLFAGYPSWHQFCEEVMAKAPRSLAPRTAPVPTFAELLEEYSNGEWLYEFIKVRFAPGFATGAIATAPVAALRRLEPPLVVTTNYDAILEDVFADSLEDVFTGRNIDPNTYRRLISHEQSPLPRTFLLKLHGSFDLMRGLVATHKQYVEAYSDPGHNRQLLSHLMTSHSMLFLGCSLHPHDAPTKVLADLKERFGDFAQEHFAVRPLPADPAEEESRLSALGVKAIFYDGPHDGFLHDVLQFLGGVTSSPATAVMALEADQLDLTVEPMPVLDWTIKHAPSRGSVSAESWESFAKCVIRNDLSSDLTISLNGAGDALELACQHGDLVERGRKKASLSTVNASLPITYRLPEREFRREQIRLLELSYDLPNSALRVVVNNEIVAAARVTGRVA